MIHTRPSTRDRRHSLVVGNHSPVPTRRRVVGNGSSTRALIVVSGFLIATAPASAAVQIEGVQLRAIKTGLIAAVGFAVTDVQTTPNCSVEMSAVLRRVGGGPVAEPVGAYENACDPSRSGRVPIALEFNPTERMAPGPYEIAITVNQDSPSGPSSAMSVFSFRTLTTVNPRLLWRVPSAWAADPNDRFEGQGQIVTRPRTLRVWHGGRGLGYQFRRLRWSGWGTSTATGRGSARYCEVGECSAWRPVRIVLTRWVVGEGVVYYSRYKAFGLLHDDGTRHRSDPVGAA